MNKRSIGTNYEEIAAEWMKRHGFRILEKNYRCRIGEIDLVAAEYGTLVFVEVKYRRSHQLGSPEAAVDHQKQKTIRKVAEYYLIQHPIYMDKNCRFDVAAFEGETLTYYRDAFGGM